MPTNKKDGRKSRPAPMRRTGYSFARMRKPTRAALARIMKRTKESAVDCLDRIVREAEQAGG